MPPDYTENGKEELLIDLNTETAVDWLNSKLEPFLYALMEWRLPTDEYETLVKGKIESWLGEEHTAEVKPVEAAEEKRTNRTRKAADDIVDKPKNLLEIITHPQYVNALGTEESGNAYLQLYRRDAIEDIIFDDGSIYFKSGNKRVLQAQLTDFRTKEGISDLDMPMLRVLYNFYLQGKRKNPEVKVVTAYIPDLYEYVTGEGKRNVPATVYLKDEAGNFVLDENGEKKRPYIIHRSSIGCYGRTMALLIEKFAGAFPVWMAPTQVKVLSLTDRTADYAKEVAAELGKYGIRAESDTRSEKIGYKIREAQMEKIPYMIVLGDKEKESGLFAVRDRAEGDLGVMTKEAFLQRIQKEVAEKTIR